MHNIVVEKMFVTSEQIEKGLMYDRDPLSSADVVALFAFETPRYAGMWMKNTPRALDMIFIRDDMTISYIHKNARPYDEKTIKGPEKVRYVVEALAGYVDAKKLQVDDKVMFSSYIHNKYIAVGSNNAL